MTDAAGVCRADRVDLRISRARGSRVLAAGATRPWRTRSGAPAGSRCRGGARPRLRRAVLAADRAADPRMRCLRRAAAGDRPRSSRSASAARRGWCSPAGPASVYEAGAPGVPDRAARSRDSDARHLLRDAGDGPGARRAGRGGRVGGVRADRADAPRRRRPAARRPARGAELLDEPPRRGLRAAGGVHRPRLEPRARRSPPARRPTAASTGSSSTPRSSTRPTGPRS